MQKQKKDKVWGLTKLDWLALLAIVFAFTCPPAFAPAAAFLVIAAVLKHLNDIKDKP
jgi:hypothetical protein